MDINTQVTLKMEPERGKEILHIKMGINIMDNGKEISIMERVHIISMMEVYMKETGRIIN